jgi:hypothetical protein
MIFEQRTYTVRHGEMDEYLIRYQTHALPLQQKHLGRLLGFFVTDLGPLNQVIHIWAYDSYADREQRRANLEADPEWVIFKDINRGTFTAQEVKIMKPAPFSPSFV